MNGTRIKKHANVKAKIVFKSNAQADLLFSAKYIIQKGEQLRWHYGDRFRLPKPCVSDCEKCELKKGKKDGTGRV